MDKLFLACIAVLLSGCLTKVNLNVGESDYRIAIKDSFVGKYERDEILPTRLINPGESLSVHLKQVFIDNYSERIERFFASVLARTVRGEIAIVARLVFDDHQCGYRGDGLDISLVSLRQVIVGPFQESRLVHTLNASR